MDAYYQSPRPTARALPQNVDHDPTHQFAAASGPVDRDHWLDAPFQAELLKFDTGIAGFVGWVKGPHVILVLRIEGLPAMVLPLEDLLSPPKVRRACLRFLDRVPTRPKKRGEAWRRTVNRWLKDAVVEHIPYTGRLPRRRVSKQRFLKAAIHRAEAGSVA
jgi:hypothetical protein